MLLLQTQMPPVAKDSMTQLLAVAKDSSKL